MAYNYEYPYNGTERYNNDWLINKVKELAEEWKQVQKDWATQQEAFESLKAYIYNYFNNLDVTKEISDKIDQMVKDGSFLQIVEPVIPDLVTKWLSDNITPTTPPVDKTLSIEGAAADAGAVGERAYLWREYITSTLDSLATLLDQGSYGIAGSISANISDMPDVLKGSTCTVSNIISFNQKYVTQKVWNTATFLYPFVRTVVTTTGVASAWQRLDTHTHYNFYGIIPDSDTIDLINFLDAGSYAISTSQSSKLVNVPDDIVGTALTLMNVKGFNNNITTQYIFNTRMITNPYARYVTKGSSQTTASAWIKNETPVMPAYNSVLTGKKWCVIGDSFTAGDFSTLPSVPTIPSGMYAGEKATYAYIIGNRTGAILTNLSKGGERMGGSDGFAANRLSEIPSDSEWITIAEGINDTPSHKDTPIGSINDTTTSTFYGAWNVLMKHIFTICPAAHIGIIATNGILPREMEYSTAIIDIAKKWCVPYLNMSFGIDVPTLDRSAKSGADYSEFALNARNIAFRVSSTNLHPNAAAHQYESVFIEEWMKTI